MHRMKTVQCSTELGDYSTVHQYIMKTVQCSTEVRQYSTLVRQYSTEGRQFRMKTVHRPGGSVRSGSGQVAPRKKCLMKLDSGS